MKYNNDFQDWEELFETDYHVYEQDEKIEKALKIREDISKYEKIRDPNINCYCKYLIQELLISLVGQLIPLEKIISDNSFSVMKKRIRLMNPQAFYCLFRWQSTLEDDVYGWDWIMEDLLNHRWALKEKRVRRWFREKVWPELMAKVWHPRNFSKFEGWGFGLD